MVVIMLKEEQKYNKFVTALTGEVNQEREKILKEIEDYKTAQIEHAEKKAKSEYKLKIQKKTLEIHESCGKYASKRILEIRKKLFTQRDEIQQKVFSKVEERLNTFVNSNEYDEFLKKNIAEFIDYIDTDSTVFARTVDVQKVTKLVDCNVVPDDTIKLGGLIMKNKNNLFNCTLDQQLVEQIVWFEENSKLNIR